MYVDSPLSILRTDSSSQCITNLLTCHRHIFIARLTCLLPLVFPFFMHPSSEVRHYTAAVLASFSQTLITHRDIVEQETIETISLHTHEFLTPETTRHPTSSRKLPPLFDAAVSSKDFGSAGENAPWALTVMANFAVLLGPSLFLYHGPLKLVMNISQKAFRYPPGRDLNPHIWCTFIWSMSQLYTQQLLSTDGDIDTVKRCVLVLKQALHGGLGAALIASLLGSTPPNFKNKSIQKWAVSSAVDILHDMLSSKSQELRHEASRLLACLTQEVGAPSNVQRETEWTVDLLLSGFLFDGSLLRADKDQVEELACSTRVFSPRCLSQEEILMHWESISSCFILVVQNSLEDGDTNLTVSSSKFLMVFSFIYLHRPPRLLCGSPSYLFKASQFRKMVNSLPPPNSPCICPPCFPSSSLSTPPFCQEKRSRLRFNCNRSFYQDSCGLPSRILFHRSGSPPWRLPS